MENKIRFFRRMKGRAILALTVIIIPFCSGCAGKIATTVQPIPFEYQSLYSQLEKKLSEFEIQLGAQEEKGTTITFAAELLPANGHRGEALLEEKSWQGMMLYLDRLQSMGIEGVKVAIKYPLLSPDFPHYSEYISFYKKLSKELKKRNMKMLAGTGPMFTDPAFTDLRVSYAELTFEKLKEETRQHIKTIIDEIEPDYVTIANEPSTESELTGIALDPKRQTELVNYVLSGLDRKKTLIGAGAGNWDSTAYIESLAKNTSIDYIDIHIYPVNRDFLLRAQRDADIARKYGKRIIIGECWLYKAAESEKGGASASGIIARDIFSFWQPLDSKFLELIVEFAKKNNIEFMSPFWSKYFFAYVEYDKATQGMSSKELLQLADAEINKNIMSKKFSQTGIAYKTLILSVFWKGDFTITRKNEVEPLNLQEHPASPPQSASPRKYQERIPFFPLRPILWQPPSSLPSPCQRSHGIL
jgi:hypothetical protein